MTSAARTRTWWPALAVVVAVAASGIAAGPARAARPKASGVGVVALIDTGINPYNKVFRDKSALARKHPSTYIPGYPRDAEALKLSLDLPYEKAVEKDAKIWAGLLRNKLYWIPGTRIVGAISMGAGGVSCPEVPVPPVANFTNGDCPERVILDDAGHGTMTASRAAGRGTSLAPTARVVAIEGLGESSVRWAADQGWIDVQSNSWINLLPPPANSNTPEAFTYASERMLTLAASGNGTAYILGVAPTPTYVLSTAPPGVILVGGHDNGRMTMWAGAPPHVIADAYGGMTGIHTSSTEVRGDPIACCTSASSPYAAGGAVAIVQQARALLGDKTPGMSEGVVASGKPRGITKGPLADGKFTLEELREVFLNTADPRPEESKHDGLVHWMGEPRAPDYTEYGPGANPFCLACTTVPITWTSIPENDATYPLIGYGAINEKSLQATKKALTDGDIPARAEADQLYMLDQQARSAIYP